MAAAPGIREEQGVPLAQTLAEALRARHMLLILDTCEHQVTVSTEKAPERADMLLSVMLDGLRARRP